MDEATARTYIADRVPRGTADLISAMLDMVVAEQSQQNLVSARTTDEMWSRHALDSAQLCWLHHSPDGSWLDIGSGAGFPGMIAGIIRQSPTVLVEPRTKRAAFLQQVVDTLGCSWITVKQRRCEMIDLDRPASFISARAVAPLVDLFDMAERHSSSETIWLLPKGRTAAEDVAAARETWHGEFDLVPSLSDPQSSIVVARHVRRKRR